MDDETRRRIVDAEAALRNLAALAPYANPFRLPPWPEPRRQQLLSLLWRDYRNYRIPHQRHWDD